MQRALLTNSQPLPCRGKGRRTSRRHTVVCVATSKTKIVLSVPKKLRGDQSMHVVGNVDGMGAWDELRGISLQHLADDNWSGELQVSPGQRLEYKYFAKNAADESLEWQPADTFFVDIPEGTEGAELTISDSWEGKKRAVSWHGLMRPVRVNKGSLNANL